MIARQSAGLCVATVFAFGVVAFAQSSGQATPPQQPGATSPSSMSDSSSSDQQVTITGCVQRESDWRSANNKGRGGAAGTGLGTGNEFVLTDASIKSDSMASNPSGEATGTSGSAGHAYELTGPNEGDAGQFVGKRVEITGKVKAAEKDASGRVTGGATAGTPPSGVDVMSKDLKLKELEVSSVRETTGSCSPIK